VLVSAVVLVAVELGAFAPALRLVRRRGPVPFSGLAGASDGGATTASLRAVSVVVAVVRLRAGLRRDRAGLAGGLALSGPAIDSPVSDDSMAEVAAGCAAVSRSDFVSSA
jgi:hypothetical protein